MSIASICVLVSCLVLTGAAELISVNIEKEVDSVGKTNETTVYIKDGASDLEAVYIGKNLEKLDNITSKVSSSSASDKSQTEVKNETKKPKEDTKIITCNLYKAGKSIDEICNIRGLTRVTVENHLLKCYEAGIDVDLGKDVQTQYKDIILNAIKLIGIEKLRPLKDALPEQVTYFDIHYYIIKYNNNDI